MDHATWPDPNNSEAWLNAAASGRLPAISPGTVVKAVRAQICIGQRLAANALAQHLSDVATRCLRATIGMNIRAPASP